MASETTYETLLMGHFRREQVVVDWQPAAERPADPAVEDLIATTWDRRQAEAPATGRLLFAGPLCRLAGWSVASHQLHLTLTPTDYRAFLGTNVAGLVTIQARHPADWPAYLVNPLGVSAALVSADGWLPVIRRSQRVAEYPGFLDVVGGNLAPQHRDHDGRISPFVAMVEEIVEETGLQPAEVGTLTCLGLARNRATAKPDLLFAARLTLARAAVEARLVGAGDAVEGAGWVWVSGDAAGLSAFVARHAADVAPSGLACLRRYAAERGASA